MEINKEKERRVDMPDVEPAPLFAPPIRVPELVPVRREAEPVPVRR